jgi:DNA polymerase-3 subunit epsilon
MRRDKVTAAVAAAGWEVAANVSARTTILVLGVQDTSKLAGSDKSTKLRKAESLIAVGQKIRIVDESGFWRLLDPANG